MTRRRTTALRRAMPNFAAALSVFGAVLVIAADICAADPLHSRLASDPFSMLGGSTAVVLLLAGVLSLLTAVNLAFFRHIRQVHASKRRGRKSVLPPQT